MLSNQGNMAECHGTRDFTAALKPINEDELIVTYMPRVHRLVGMQLRGGQRLYIDRDDLLAEGYQELTRTIRADPSPEGISIEGRIVRNVKTALIRYLKKRKLDRIYASQPMPASIIPERGDDRDDPGDALDRLMYRKCQQDEEEYTGCYPWGADDLHTALTLVTAVQREVVELYYFEGYSIAEIARIRGTSPKAVECALAGAITKLKKIAFDTSDFCDSGSPYGIERGTSFHYAGPSILSVPVNVVSTGHDYRDLQEYSCVNRSFLIDAEGTARTGVAQQILGVDHATMQNWACRGRLRFQTVTIGERSYRRFLLKDLPKLGIMGALHKARVPIGQADDLADAIVEAVSSAGHDCDFALIRNGSIELRSLADVTANLQADDDSYIAIDLRNIMGKIAPIVKREQARAELR